ncbi:MAG: hypothetical protein FJ083_12225 [Cyanobacteria bacterium K_Offshore_surface_m2_239]|nr:hypothetical protein [Cyanobacteria bacterium K_Offshore_surface_m2_239]
MPKRQRGLVRTGSAILVIGLSLVLLVGRLHHHFTPTLSDWKRTTSARSAVARQGWSQHPYVFRDEALAKPSASADKTVRLGMEITNIYGLSLRDRTFQAEGWYWLKWPELVQTVMKENEIAQDKIINLINQVDSDSMLIEIEQPNPERLKDESYWQKFHFSGTFYIEDLQLRAFPFDDLVLPIAMELGPDLLSCYPENELGCFSLIFDKDSNAQALGQYTSINGYSIIGSESREFLHQYSTNFGRSSKIATSAVQTNVVYRANFTTAFWIYIFPLLVLIGVSIASPSLPGSLGDVRLAIPTTILLTLIFLQMGYKAELPALEYVSYLDWIYIYAYAISALLFLLFCWGTNAHANACGEEQEAEVLRGINRVDLLVQWLAFGGLVLVMASGLLFEP